MRMLRRWSINRSIKTANSEVDSSRYQSFCSQSEVSVMPSYHAWICLSSKFIILPFFWFGHQLTCISTEEEAHHRIFLKEENEIHWLASCQYFLFLTESERERWVYTFFFFSFLECLLERLGSKWEITKTRDVLASFSHDCYPIL